MEKAQWRENTTHTLAPPYYATALRRCVWERGRHGRVVQLASLARLLAPLRGFEGGEFAALLPGMWRILIIDDLVRLGRWSGGHRGASQARKLDPQS